MPTVNKKSVNKNQDSYSTLLFSCFIAEYIFKPVFCPPVENGGWLYFRCVSHSASQQQPISCKNSNRVKHWLISSFLCGPSVSMHDKRVSVSGCVAGLFCLPEATGQRSPTNHLHRQDSTTYCKASESKVCQQVVQVCLKADKTGFGDVNGAFFCWVSIVHASPQKKRKMEKIASQRIILEVVASGRAAYGNLCEIRDLFMVY